MESLGLLTICLSAFISVFVLLTVLALAMRLILVIFPVQAADTDAAIIAAITAAAGRAFPGTSVAKIEEVK
jgi:hypothetical protein